MMTDDELKVLKSISEEMGKANRDLPDSSDRPQEFKEWDAKFERLIASGLASTVSAVATDMLMSSRRLREVVGKMPVTADGVRVVPGSVVYRAILNEPGRSFGLVQGSMYWESGDGLRGLYHNAVFRGPAANVHVPIKLTYSTMAAAERAAKGGE